MEVNQEQQFKVDTKGAGGQGQLEVAVVSFYFFFNSWSVAVIVFFHVIIMNRKHTDLSNFLCACVLQAESQPASSAL